MRISDAFPAPNDLLQLEPEDLAFLLLRYLEQAPSSEHNRYNFSIQPDLRAFAADRHEEVRSALSEAWSALERAGLIAIRANDSSGNWIFITRRGRKLLESGDAQAFFLGNLVPAARLDPQLATTARPIFLRGDYDTAVFAAFKELEVRVRGASGQPAESIGVKLMRTAFDPSTGALADPSVPTAEREAASQLFAGAIALFKNPSSHRGVQYDAQEAADLIRFADYLIRWVDRRGAAQNP